MGQGSIVFTSSSSCSVSSWLTSGSPTGIVSWLSRGAGFGIVRGGAGGVGKIPVPRAPNRGKRERSMSFIPLALRYWACSKTNRLWVKSPKFLVVVA